MQLHLFGDSMKKITARQRADAEREAFSALAFQLEMHGRRMFEKAKALADEDLRTSAEADDSLCLLPMLSALKCLRPADFRNLRYLRA